MKHRIVECASLPLRLPEPVAREADLIVKGLPEGCAYQRKAYTAADIWFEPGERAEVSILTTEIVDYAKEVVLVKGLDLGPYRQSLAVLWNHRQDLPPVGNCAWIKDHKDTIRAKTIYPERAAETKEDRPFYLDQIWELVSSKPPVLRAKSIGFLPTEPKREPTPEELEAHPDWAGAGVWPATTLLEYSCVSIGCNASALLEAVNTKSLDLADIKALGLEMPEAPPVPVAVTVSHEVVAVTKSATKAADLAAAIAYARSRIKLRKKAPDIGQLLADALGLVEVNVDRIVALAEQRYKQRGRAVP